jgi:hypothetical protein
MSKQGGLGARYYLAGNDLSGDIQDVKIASPVGQLDVTDITQSAHSRLGGLRDASMGVTSYFDPSVAHPVFAALPTTDVIGTFAVGAAIGSPAASMVGKQLNYDGTRATDGMFTFTVDETANGFGLEWGVLLTAGMRTDTGAVNGTAWDFGGASPSVGAQAYLHVAAFVGTDVTIKLQDSANNSAFSDVTGGGFTQVTGGAPLAQRIATAGNLQVREYVRAVTVTSGGFSSVTFAVVVVVNQTAVVF